MINSFRRDMRQLNCSTELIVTSQRLPPPQGNAIGGTVDFFGFWP